MDKLSVDAVAKVDAILGSCGMIVEPASCHVPKVISPVDDSAVSKGDMHRDKACLELLMIIPVLLFKNAMGSHAL